MTKKLLKSLAVVCLLAGMGQAQNGNQGTLIASSTDCTTAGSCVSVKFDQPAAVGGSTVSLSGSFTATVQFEASNDGKALSDSTKTWVAINGTPANGTVAVTSATTANTWQFNVAGYTDIRARASAWTSAPTVVIRSTLTSAKSGGGGAAYASGLGTNNVIPKGNGAGQLADSSITDNGTNVISTEAILGAVGTSTLPGYAFTGGATQNASGMWWVSGSVGIIGTNGTTGWLTIGANNGGIQTGAIQSIGWSSTSTPFGNNSDLLLGRRGAASLRMGAADVNGSPVAQTLGVQNAITGSNLVGSQFTIAGPLGTGTGLPAPVVIQGADPSVASGATAQTEINRFVSADTRNLTSGAATTLLSIPLATLQTAGGLVSIHMEATDGTNQCTLDDLVTYSAENSAGVFVTQTSKMGTGSTACTATKTLTATYAVTSANPALLQVTPTLTGITATRFTAVYTVMHGGMTNPTL